MSRECASNDSQLDGPRTYSGTINAHGSGHIFQGNHNVGQLNDMRQFYTGKIPGLLFTPRSEGTLPYANGRCGPESSNSFQAVEYLAQSLAAILEDTRLLLQDIEVDDNGRQAVALAERCHAKIIEDLQAVRERWLRIEDDSASSVERSEMLTQMKDIKTRIKADTSWLTMKHTEYTQ
jgi:hypothetical protein